MTFGTDMGEYEIRLLDSYFNVCQLFIFKLGQTKLMLLLRFSVLNAWQKYLSQNSMHRESTLASLLQLLSLSDRLVHHRRSLSG